MKGRKDKQPIWLENRPNRNVKSLDQSLEDGYEIGDGGSFVSELEEQIDADLFIQRLTGRQQQVAKMLYEGYKQVEIAQKLGVNKSVVNKVVARIKNRLPF
jgi:DNA-binding NarL/FixJ family response regulator